MPGPRTTIREWRPEPAPSAVVDDPRMRARRAEVARGRGRRRLRRIKAVLAVVCVVVWTLVVLRSALLDVDRVQVVGAERVTADEVRAAAATTSTGTPMLDVDTGAATAAVAALPWIDEVRVTKLWPGTVRIVVTERHEVATVEAALPDGDDGWALVDHDGRVVAHVAERPDLPALPGTRSTPPGRRLGADDRVAVAVLGDLPSVLRDATEEAVEGDDGLELVLDDGFRVVLGDGDDLEAKAESAEAVREHAGEPGESCRIDVRVPTAPVLTTGRGCA